MHSCGAASAIPSPAVHTTKALAPHASTLMHLSIPLLKPFLRTQSRSSFQLRISILFATWQANTPGMDLTWWVERYYVRMHAARAESMQVLHAVSTCVRVSFLRFHSHILCFHIRLLQMPDQLKEVTGPVHSHFLCVLINFLLSSILLGTRTLRAGGGRKKLSWADWEAILHSSTGHYACKASARRQSTAEFARGEVMGSVCEVHALQTCQHIHLR